MLAVITPTRNRPLTMSLLARWMRQQTRQPDAWIVVSDGEEDPKFEMPMTRLLIRARRSDEPPHTLCLNLRAFFTAQLAMFDRYLVCEDDEYYAPTYVEQMSARLDHAVAVGIGHSKYYHLGLRRFHIHENMGHASLAQTGFRREALGEFLDALEDPAEKFIDVKFWRKVRSRGLIWRDGHQADGAAGAQYVGMKGLPGQPGIGFGHKAMPQYFPDPELEQLRKWIRPEDFAEYERLGREHLWASSRG